MLCNRLSRCTKENTGATPRFVLGAKRSLQDQAERSLRNLSWNRPARARIAAGIRGPGAASREGSPQLLGPRPRRHLALPARDVRLPRGGRATRRLSYRTGTPGRALDPRRPEERRLRVVRRRLRASGKRCLQVRRLVLGWHRSPGLRETRSVAVIVTSRLDRDEGGVEHISGTVFACEAVSLVPAFHGVELFGARYGEKRAPLLLRAGVDRGRSRGELVPGNAPPGPQYSRPQGGELSEDGHGARGGRLSRQFDPRA